MLDLKNTIRKLIIRYSKNSIKMLCVRLILLVLATTLICDDSLGVELNDRIDQVLSVIMKMNYKVDVLTGKVNRMEKTVHTISENTGLLGYKLVGRGWEGSHDDEVQHKGVTTMKECLELCHTKRLVDGGEWNGVTWKVSSGTCYCEKNDRGHIEYSGSLHFRTQ